MFRRIITASFLKRVTKISLAKLTPVKIPLAGLGVVFLAMGLALQPRAANAEFFGSWHFEMRPDQTRPDGGVVLQSFDASTGVVTLKITGTLNNDPSPFDLIPFSALVVYDVDDGFVPGGVQYPATIILTVDGEGTVTNTTSRIILDDSVIGGPDDPDEDCADPTAFGDSIQIGDEGDGTDPSGWDGPLFGGVITGLSWNFADCDGSAFDLGNFDTNLPIVPPASEIFDRTYNGGLNLVELASTLAVDIDIKPGSDPNSINLGSGGTTPVAVLGSASLDVNDIDPDSLTLGTAGIKTVGKTARTLCSVNDVNSDGFDDLVCHFITVDIVHEEGDTEATLSGELNDGTLIEGSDSVNIVP